MSEQVNESEPTLQSLVAQLVTRLRQTHQDLVELRIERGPSPAPTYFPGDDDLQELQELGEAIWLSLSAKSLPAPSKDGHGWLNLPIDIVTPNWPNERFFETRTDVEAWCSKLERLVATLEETEPQHPEPEPHFVLNWGDTKSVTFLDGKTYDLDIDQAYYLLAITESGQIPISMKEIGKRFEALKQGRHKRIRKNIPARVLSLIEVDGRGAFLKLGIVGKVMPDSARS